MVTPLTCFRAWKEDDTADSSDAWCGESAVRAITKIGCVYGGRYRLERRLGAGGMASIWSAIDERAPDGSPPVAVKVIGASLAGDPTLRQRFDHEIAITRLLTGPAFAQTLDHGVHRGVPYLVMELLEGEDLHARLRKVGRLTLEETQTIVRAIASGLSLAHAAGIIHRDLKPHNVFIAQGDGGEQVKLLDFGVAKVGSASIRLTGQGSLVGSAHYMSPEQARWSTEVDYRTDLWSLAAIAYRCISGSKPFQGDANLVLENILHCDPTPVSHLVPGLSTAFDEFFQRVLAKQAGARFQSAKDLADSFDRAVKEAQATGAIGAVDAFGRSGARSVRPTSRTAVTMNDRQDVAAPTTPGDGGYAAYARELSSREGPSRSGLDAPRASWLGHELGCDHDAPTRVGSVSMVPLAATGGERPSDVPDERPSWFERGLAKLGLG